MAEKRSIIVVSAVALAVITAGGVVWFLSQPNNFTKDDVVVDSTTPAPETPEVPPQGEAPQAPTEDQGQIAQDTGSAPSPLPVPMTAATGTSLGFILTPLAAMVAGITGLLRIKK